MSIPQLKGSPLEGVFSDASRQVVCVQGIGFVGSAMAVAVAAARDADGRPRFNVVGVDLDSPKGRERVTALKTGRLPCASMDSRLIEAHRAALAEGNLTATTDPSVYAAASVAIVDVNLDVGFEEGIARSDFTGFKDAISTLADTLPPGALMLVETTVPPGTCERIVVPTVRERLKSRGLGEDSILVAHSYERVMPGVAYLDSIANFWRVYSGWTEAAAEACASFLAAIIDTEKYPLTKVAPMCASEIGKVLENSYRATTIAFMEEWARLAERIGVDLFPVIDAIRLRPTHSNMRQPGFGVGGYCLTKDPLLSGVTVRQIYGWTDLTFPFSELAVETNRRMPLQTLRRVSDALGGSIRGRRLLLLGVSYRPDVADTRHAPSETFVRAALADGAHVDCHDPLISRWEELGIDLPADLPSAEGYDAVIFASPHPDYKQLDLGKWLGDHRPLVVDANRVLTGVQLAHIRISRLPFRSIGRGSQS